jgi:hypothetical protein
MMMSKLFVIWRRRFPECPALHCRPSKGLREARSDEQATRRCCSANQIRLIVAQKWAVRAGPTFDANDRPRRRRSFARRDIWSSLKQDRHPRKGNVLRFF